MKADSKRRPHGRWIRAAGGYRAYVPEALPPAIEWNRVYCARAMLEILEKPPRLATESMTRRRARRT